MGKYLLSGPDELHTAPMDTKNILRSGGRIDFALSKPKYRQKDWENAKFHMLERWTRSQAPVARTTKWILYSTKEKSKLVYQ